MAVREFCVETHVGTLVDAARPEAFLCGGGALIGTLSVTELRSRQLIHGSVDHLRGDVVAVLSSVSADAPSDCRPNTVCVLMPLHEVASRTSFRQVNLYAPLLHMSAGDLRAVGVVALRERLTLLCCNSSCIMVYAMFVYPELSQTSPVVADGYLPTPPSSLEFVPQGAVGSAPVAVALPTHVKFVNPVTGKSIQSNDVFVGYPSPPASQSPNYDDVLLAENCLPTTFPPLPLSSTEAGNMVREWCTEVSKPALQESACASCGVLVKVITLTEMRSDDPLLMGLCRPEVTRMERNSSDQSIQSVSGPVLCDEGIRTVDGSRHCDICQSCLFALRNRALPQLALANGRWLGAVPVELRELNFMEKVLIARYRHNCCIIRVHKGGYKLRANAVVFAQPVAKLLTVLPMKREELDSVVAVLFTGSVAPTSSDFKRTPFLIRRRYVWRALVWLKLNHCDYIDVQLSEHNLHTYADGELPVAYFHQKTTDAEPEETLASSDRTKPTGTEDGAVPLSVHGVTDTTLGTLSYDEQVLTALRHLRNGGNVLSVGRKASPESVYDNPQLFPGMFPWLFPYGYGGFGNERVMFKIPLVRHVRSLLMYADRRFQEDAYFPFIVFNQSQIRQSSVGGYLLTERKNFGQVANKILDLDPSALEGLIERSKKEGFARAETPAEKQCYDILNYVDSVAGHVAGSTTQRKYQRNEIRSLIIEEGVPTFFITFAPPPYKNRVCLYFCGERIDFEDPGAELPEYQKRARAVARNPVACARFFHVLVQTFLKVVLRVNSDRDGLFGATSAYYGTVEEQGRLALHLHLLLWVKGSYSPQQIRDKLLSDDTQFRASMIQWLESCHQGEFSTGSLTQVRERINRRTNRPLTFEHAEDDEENGEILPGDPTSQLPSPPPLFSSSQDAEMWYGDVRKVADEVVYRSNRHSPDHKYGCRTSKGQCRARFPRETRQETSVDEVTGALLLKKREPWINSYSVTLSYLLRCNTDVTCLMSGTTVRAIVAYVTDYVTKSSLKTHVMFEVIRSVLSNKAQIVDDSADREDSARRLFTKIVNALTSKTEIGGPMVCSQLLGHPEHYTDRVFKKFFWTSYARVVADVWNDTPEADGLEDNPTTSEEKVVINANENGLVPYRKVCDYIHRPVELENFSLVDYLCMTDVVRLPTSKADSRDESEDSEGEIRPRINERPKSNGKKTALRFTKGHPNYGTHGVSVRRKGMCWVLTYIGPPLPRKDRGDREIYCRVMLVLFRPWRTGLELRESNQSWDSAFCSYTFSAHQRRIMDNMNVLYECKDAAHDFAAQRRSEANASMLGSFYDEDVIRGLADNSREMDGLFELSEEDSIDFIEGSSTRLSKTLQTDKVTDDKNRREVMQMDAVAARLHPWHSSCEPQQSEPLLHTDVHPDIWKQRLSLARQNAARLRNNPSTGDSAPQDIAMSQYKVKITNLKELEGDTYFSSVTETQLFQATPQMQQIASIFSLNNAQLKAFILVASRVTTPNSPPLRMYLGGVGGTGKSQVIKALVAYFALRNEPHRFRVMAPTGSAAAQVDGSTYHSMFGFGKGQGELSRKRLALLKDLHGPTDLYLLDEISMMSAADFRSLSERMDAVFNTQDAFGGKHVVVCGDFGQLPPAGRCAVPLYNSSVRSKSGTSKHNQHSVMGIALWHTFTTVIFLRENMRQKGMSETDKLFRVALENMRLGACTPSDLALLRTRVSDGSPLSPHIGQSCFRDVSVIIGRNAKRDAINYVSAARFASQRKEAMITFASRDSWGAVEVNDSIAETRKSMVSTVDVERPSNKFGRHIRDALWGLPPRRTDHVSGLLQLCKGMPVLLKSNEATELCATNGAEAVVVGWDSIPYPGTSGYHFLQTLFVKLVKPPRSMTLPELPENVVPIVPASSRFKFEVVDGKHIPVKRIQAHVLPNFAMTDYASQGRTRKYNVVDLRDCNSHMSMYTALSRGSTLSGTLILYPFDSRRITSGLSKDLRREFRELEILAACTEEEMSGTLPFTTTGHSRAYIVAQYQRWKGIHHVPTDVHPALDWSKESVNDLLPLDDLCNSENSKNFTRVGKRLLPSRFGDDCSTEPKRRKIMPAKNVCAETSLHRVQPPPMSSPTLVGFKWDSTNWSCAYDSLFMVLYNVFAEGRFLVPDSGAHLITPALRSLYDGFTLLASSPQSVTPEVVRDRVRDMLCSDTNHLLPRHGARPSFVDYLAETLFPVVEPYASYSLACECCGNSSAAANDPFLSYVFVASSQVFPRSRWQDGVHTTDMLRILFAGGHDSTCVGCKTKRVQCNISFTHTPSILMLCLQPTDPLMPCVAIDQNVDFSDIQGGCRWALGGVVYLGQEHFTSRYVNSHGHVWCHDGMTQGNHPIYEGILANLNMSELQQRRACLAVYVRSVSATTSS